jgi:hypothetical protein
VLVARKTQERSRQFWQRSRHNAGDVIVANLHAYWVSSAFGGLDTADADAKKPETSPTRRISEWPALDRAHELHQQRNRAHDAELLRHRPTRSGSAPIASARGRGGHSTAFSPHRRKSSTRASGAASTSAPRTCKARSSAAGRALPGEAVLQRRTDTQKASWGPVCTPALSTPGAGAGDTGGR